MLKKYPLLIIYLSMFIPTFILYEMFSNPYKYYNEGSLFILLFNTILFLTLIKLFKINKKKIIIFFFIILILFIIPIIDKDLFYSTYVQSTPNQLMFPIVDAIISMILAPFILIFDYLYSLGVFDLCYLLIPLYIILLMCSSILILSFNNKNR